MDDGFIGRSLHRLEDVRFLTGRGRYVEDIDLPGQLHAVVLRSPHGHAAIDGIDTADARARCRGCTASSPPPISTPTASGRCRASPRSRPSRR